MQAHFIPAKHRVVKKYWNGALFLLTYSLKMFCCGNKRLHFRVGYTEQNIVETDVAENEPKRSESNGPRKACFSLRCLPTMVPALAAYRAMFT